MKLFIGTAVLVGMIACGSSLSQMERDELLNHARKLEECRHQGTEAGSYQVYENCKADAGIK